MWKDGKLIKLKIRSSFELHGLRYDIVRDKWSVYVVYDDIQLVSKDKVFESTIQDMFTRQYKKENFTKKRILEFVEKVKKLHKQ